MTRLLPVDHRFLPDQQPAVRCWRCGSPSALVYDRFARRFECRLPCSEVRP